MREGEAVEVDYWQGYVPIGEVPVHGEPAPLYLRTHTAEERYSEREEVVPLQHKRGERLYVHAKPCLLLPETTLTAALHRKAEGSEIGRVVDVQERGLRPHAIGQAQAWFYPADELLILWECYLFEGYRTARAEEDQVHAFVWQGFERCLLERLPDAKRVVTPAWEDIYGREDWQAFLEAQGYQPFNRQAMLKALEGHAL